MPKRRAPTRQYAMQTKKFGGIVQALKELVLSISPTVFSPKASNFWIKNGSLTVRNAFEELDAISLADGYTYMAKRLFVHTAATPKLLALCDAKLGGTHHHYCLLARDLDGGAWAEVKNGPFHGFTANSPMWFSNPNFSFVNYSGDFYETKATTLATVMANEQDIPMFYTPAGFGVLGFPDWKAVTVAPDTNILTATSLATLDDTVEFYSTTQQMPGGLESFKGYYAVNVSGNTFKVSLTLGGAAIDITSAGANVVGRLTKDYGLWSTVTVTQSTSKFTLADMAKNGTAVMFSAPSGTLPRGILSTRAYYVVNASGSTWQVSDKANGDPITLTSAGNNVKVRTVKNNPADAPRGGNLMVSNDRLLMTLGDTVYYNAGYYDNAAHPNEWGGDAGKSGFVKLMTWDGDSVKSAKALNGKPVICKENSVFMLDGAHPPYAVRQLFTAKGTVAPESLCIHVSGIYYASAEGILRFNGASTEAFLTDEISGMWYPNNTGCICNVVGDTMFISAQFYHPVTGLLGQGLMMVHLPSKTVCYQDLTIGETALTVDCVLDPWQTTLNAGVVEPEHWFACNGKIYRYGTTRPSEAAAPLNYYFPSSAYDDPSFIKDPVWLYVTGRGGTCKITPIIDGVALSNTYTLELPETVQVVEQMLTGLSGRTVGWLIENVGGDPIEIQGFEVLFEKSRS